jgi:hypothetical protein
MRPRPRLRVSGRAGEGDYMRRLIDFSLSACKLAEWDILFKEELETNAWGKRVEFTLIK